MTILHRRILYSAFIVLFLVITPLVAFYAAGYTINAATGAVEQTAILMVKTEPRGAAVQLTGTARQNWLYNLRYGNRVPVTPLKLRNVAPGSYDITITQDGYHAYRNQVALAAGQTVVLDNILLLRAAAPELVAAADMATTTPAALAAQPPPPPRGGFTHDVMARDGITYALETTGGESRLALYRGGETAAFKNVALPATRSYEFRYPDEDLVYVFDTTHGILYLIDPWSFLPVQDSLTNVRDVRVYRDGIVYWNDFELWVYDRASRRRMLLTRISERINEALALEKNYTVYVTDSGMYVIAYGDDASSETLQLANWHGVSDVTLGANGRYLHFNAPLDDGRGLYRLEVF